MISNCLQKLKQEWHSFSPLSLESEDLIEKSYKDPPFFQKLLWEFSSYPEQKSLHEKSYDFYHDLVSAHPHSSTAFTLIKEDGKKVEWSYKKLDQCVTFQLQKLQTLQIKPKQIIAIALPTGFEFLIATLACLKLGAILCPLPSDAIPLSPKTQLSLILQLNPSLIITNQEFQKEAETTNIPLFLLEDSKEESSLIEIPSYAYCPKEIALIGINPYGKEALSLFSLDAHSLYFHLQRDAEILFPIKEENSCLSFARLQAPYPYFMTLLKAANIVHVTNKCLIKNPHLLKEEKLHIVLLDATVLQLWAKEDGFPSKHLKMGFVSSFEINSIYWKPFIQKNRLEKTLFCHGVLNSTAGGLSLISRPFLSNPPAVLKVGFGLAWYLKDPLTKQPSLQESGVFCLNKTQESNVFLSLIQNDILISGTSFPAKEGITAPTSQIEDCVKTLPFIKNACLSSNPKLGYIGTYSFTLLVFTDPLKNDILEKELADWKTQIENEITHSLSSFFIPDKIEFFPLIPKTDRSWIIEQYKKGILTKKKKIQVYQIISILKTIARNSI